MHSEYLSFMLLPGLDGEFVEGDVKEFDGAVAGGYDDLVLVRFRPREIVEGVLSVKPFLRCNSFCCEVQDVEPPISHETVVGRGCHCDFGVNKRGVFDSVAIEALSAELQHADCL